MIEQAALKCEPLGDVFVESLSGQEGMHQLPRWEARVLVRDGYAVTLSDIIGAPAQMVLGDEFGGVRSFALMVQSARLAERGPRGQRYLLTLTSALWGLTQRRGYAVFRDKTTDGIIKELLEAAGKQDVLSLRLSESYSERAFTVQHNESEWDFLARLLREDGIASFIDDDGETPKLVLTDSASGHGPIAGETMRFDDTKGMRAGESFFSLEREYSQMPERAAASDYDVLQPDVRIDATDGEGDADDRSAEMFEYPARVANQEAADARAAVRLRQHQRDAVLAKGQTHSVRLVPGQWVDLVGPSDDALAGKHLIVKVTHRLVQATPDQPQGVPYLATVTMIPFDETHTYPPTAPHSRDRGPRIGGLQSAEVTGPEGEEVHVDGLGRIKVRLPYDRSERRDDQSSDWVRTMQWNMAGSMMLPRVGWEVPLVYGEGCPDEPIALGRLYHGASPLPYELPATKATGTLQSATVPSDGGSCNELRFADDAGKQEMMLHASRDQTVSVGGDLVVDVAANQTLDAAVARKLSIKGSQSLDIGASQSITVSAAMATKVDGSRSVSVGASETIGADLSRIEHVGGGYDEVIAGVSATRCNHHNMSVKGAYALTVGGAIVVGAGCGTNELVGGARVETVAGARHIKCGKADEDTVGLHATTAGVASFKAGATVAYVAKAAAKVDAATTSMTAGGTLVIEAPVIRITAGTATLGKGPRLKLSGSHKASGAKVSVKAAIVKHAGGTKATS